MSRTDRTFDACANLEHEEVRLVRGTRTGMPIAVAVHSTQRGPAIGGCRITTYPGWRDGVEDVLRLSRAMTMKCALAELPHGGGKTVVALPPGGLDPERRTELISDVAEVIDGFDGRYICGPDIGSTPHDMAQIHRLARGSAFCRPESEGGSGNSSAATARGVVAALRAGVSHHYQDGSIADRKVGVIGFGSVGALVACSLARDGARVLVSDTNTDLREQVRGAGLEWAGADLLREELDVLVPAATGGMLTSRSAKECRAGLIVGPANNQLAHDDIDLLLHERGITWVPDVLAGAGGIIHAVCREKLGLDTGGTDTRIDRIGDKTAQLLAHATEHHTTPLRAAHQIAAQDRIQAPA